MEVNAFEQLDKLFDELVPKSGKAESLAGELVRAASRIGYRFFNDGDMVGVGYGKETCNPAARFLLEKGGIRIKGLVQGLWEVTDETAYEAILDALIHEVSYSIDQNPELREMATEDMVSYRNSDEDVDDSWLEECDYDEK